MSALCIPRTPPPFFASNGMGAESSAWLYRIMTDPSSRPEQILPDYSNLIVATAQTGDEWSLTGELVEEHILPLLRARNVRFVEVARKGPTKADGVAILQDSRQPERLHLEGVYKLSDENRESGTMPILSGHHTCAQKSKGEPLDWWRSVEIGEQPYYHFLGYNYLEESRINRDAGYKMGGRRMPVYPLRDWKWSRDDCVDYLLMELGIVWPKSCCRQCPYINKAGWPDQLARFVDRPAEAVAHIIDEYVCLALNPRSGLYGPGKSLIQRLIRDGAKEVITLAVERMRAMPWAVYRVRRRYNAPALAPRSVQKLMIGSRAQIKSAFADISNFSGIPLVSNERIKGAAKRSGDLDTYSRLWVKRREEDTYPSLEEFCVMAPAQAHDKAQPRFEDVWADKVTDLLVSRERQVGRAVKVVASLAGDTRRRDAAGVYELAA